MPDHVSNAFHLPSSEALALHYYNQLLGARQAGIVDHYGMSEHLLIRSNPE